MKTSLIFINEHPLKASLQLLFDLSFELYQV